MPRTEPQRQRTLNLIVLIIGLLSLIGGTFLSPPDPDLLVPMVFLIVILAALEFLPLRLFDNQFSMIPLILFSAASIYGSGVALWACIIGISIAVVLQLIFAQRITTSSPNNQKNLRAGIFDFGINSFVLVASLSLFGMAQGVLSLDFVLNENWLLILGAGIFYGGLHGVTYSILSYISSKGSVNQNRWDLLALLSLEILPVFFVFISLLFYSLIGDRALIIVGVATFALALLVFYLGAPRKNLERRIQELSALGEISKVLSSDIDLERLLNSIQVQVTKLLNVDNFYVALVDPIDQQIWYPIAVKHGMRQVWQRRPLMDRLTDRVIIDGEPILIPSDGRHELSKIGLPVGEDAPFAWIGVPLITSKQIIGCLALFSLSPGAGFSDEDLNLLNILSGQTSVAIEIALHNALLSSDITIGRDRLTTILNSVNEGLVLIDSAGQITMVNEAVTTLSGIPQSEFLGQTVPELPDALLNVIGYSRNDSNTFIQNQFSLENLVDEKLTYKFKDRIPELFVERSSIKVYEEDGKISGTIILLRDVTDEYLLKQTQDLISETLVHDLRSPLSSTISALDVIGDAHISGDPAGILEPSIQIAKRSSRRMLAMVESILEINRMESGKLELSLTGADLPALVNETIPELQITATDYHVTVTLEAEPGIPQIVLDKNKIQRVINNLIDNALKFSPDGGQVLVKVVPSNEENIEIHVLDRGPGIPDEYTQSIFDRFFQIPGHSSRKRGTGLGLTYCKLITEAHHGKIWVKNRRGGGSDFGISLPISGP